MPLTTDQENCLEQIKGNAGIISTTGSKINGLRLGRGAITLGVLNNPSLNILAKIFFKAEIETPVYTSLIHDTTTNIITISYMSTPPRWALEDTKIEDLQTELQNFIYDDDHKVKLFQKMYRYRNDILQYKLADKANEERVKKLNSQANNYDFFNRAKHYYDDANSETLVNNPLFREFALTQFDLILPNIQNAIPLMMHNQIRAMNTETLRNQYRDMHVEVKGMAFTKTQSANSHQFNIGLAHRDDVEPGCCTGCSAEFEAVTSVTGDIFNRTGDFRQNFPPKNYQPSPLVTSEEDIFKNYTAIINQRLTETQNTHAGHVIYDPNHSFFDAADQVINPPLQDVQALGDMVVDQVL